jgi:hypothetical protein
MMGKDSTYFSHLVKKTYVSNAIFPSPPSLPSLVSGKNRHLSWWCGGNLLNLLGIPASLWCVEGLMEKVLLKILN